MKKQLDAANKKLPDVAKTATLPAEWKVGVRDWYLDNGGTNWVND